MLNKTHTYTVLNNEQATHNVYSLKVGSPDGNPVFHFKPGQFAMIHLAKDGAPWRKEAYSIASSPLHHDHLEFGYKVFGEFTQTLAKLKPGDPVEISGPYGTFTLHDDMKDVAFVSGGIGISPFLSMIRYACEKPLASQLTVLDFNHSGADVAYRDELELCAQRNLRLHLKFFVSDNTNDPSLEQARLNEDLLEQHAAPIQQRYYFLCGPKGFMEVAKNFYLSRGIPKEHIKVEKF